MQRLLDVDAVDVERLRTEVTEQWRRALECRQPVTATQVSSHLASEVDDGPLIIKTPRPG
jgi:hypothetical protein